MSVKISIKMYEVNTKFDIILHDKFLDHPEETLFIIILSIYILRPCLLLFLKNIINLIFSCLQLAFTNVLKKKP